MGIDNDFDDQDWKVIHFLHFFSSADTGLHLPMYDIVIRLDRKQALDLAIQTWKRFQSRVQFSTLHWNYTCDLWHVAAYCTDTHY